MADDDRNALEARAYGEGTSDDERGAALRELARQRAARQRAVRGRGPADPSFSEAEDPTGPGESVGDDSENGRASGEAPRRPRTRGIIAGVAALALLVGAGAGIAAMLAFGGGRSASVEDSATESGSTSDLLTTVADPAETSRLAAGDAAVGSDGLETTLEAADELLARSATAADKYPISFDLNESFDEKSTRLITAAGTGTDVFVARAAEPDGGFCLLVAGRVRSAQDSSAAVTCATRADFAAGGLSLLTDDYTITWIGGQVSVTVGRQ